MTNNKGGRPTVQVDVDEILIRVTLGVPKTVIAQTFGICRSTVYKIIREASNEHNK